MSLISKRPRMKRLAGLVATAAVGGAALIGATVAPAHADFDSKLYPTLAKCNAARPSYESSWTMPEACHPMYDSGTSHIAGYMFLVKTVS